MKEFLNSVFVYFTLLMFGVIYIPLGAFCYIVGKISDLWSKIWKH